MSRRQKIIFFNTGNGGGLPGSADWGLISGDITDQSDLNDALALIGGAALNTGVGKTTDTLELQALNDTTLRITAAQNMFFTELFAPGMPFDEAMVSFPQTDFALAGLGLVADGTYIRYIGYDVNGVVQVGTANFFMNQGVAHLGFVMVKRVGGVTTFLDGAAGPRNVHSAPMMASSSLLERAYATNQSNVEVAPNAGGMTFAKRAGVMRSPSVNWHGGANIHELQIAAQTPASFTRINPSTASSPALPAASTAFVCNTWWNGVASVVMAAPGNASVQRWLIGIKGGLWLQEGEFQYTNLADAVDNIFNAPFTSIYPFDTYAEVARTAAVRSCTDVGNNAQSVTVETGGTGAGGGSSGGASNVFAESLLGVTIAPNVVNASLNNITPIGGTLTVTGGVRATIGGDSITVGGLGVGYLIEFTRANPNYFRASSAGGIFVFETGGANERARITDTGLTVTGSSATALTGFPFSGGSAIGAQITSFASGASSYGLDMRRFTGSSTDHQVAYIGQYDAGGGTGYPIGFFFDNNKTTNTQATTLRASIDQDGLAVTGAISATNGDILQTVTGADAVLRQTSSGGSGQQWFLVSRTTGEWTVSNQSFSRHLSVTNAGLAVYSSGTVVGNFTSTGLAVTGGVTASGSITSSAALGTVDIVSTTPANRSITKYTNGGGDYFIGVNNDTGSNFGGSGYSLFRFAPTGRVIQDNINSVPITTVSSTGLAVTGTATASDFIMAGGESFGLTNSMLGVAFTGPAYGFSIRNLNDVSGAKLAAFRKGDGTEIGSISRVGTTDAVAYNTSSDARLKKNVRDYTGTDSGPIIDALRPRWFDWKEGTDNDSKNIIGFIAQEEFLAAPELARIGAVTPGDDKPDFDPKTGRGWMRSDTALVPILVAELKSLRVRLATAESKLATL